MRGVVTPEPGTGVPLGAYFRMSAAAVLGAAAKLIERYIFACLQAHGMFCRETAGPVSGGGGLCIIAADQTNQGGNGPDWQTAGVTLDTSTGGSLYAAKLGSAIPWDKLEYLQPPSP